jgi:DNA (cytosine-5)-methyltransferase 1
MKPGKNITPYQRIDEVTSKNAAATTSHSTIASTITSDECAVHATQEAAYCMENSLDVPTDIASLIDSGVARFISGLRVGSQSCAMAASATEPCSKAAPVSQEHFTYIELFAGIGGYRAALDHMGGKCVFASELNEASRSTYQAAFGEMPHGDITEVEATDIAAHDLLTAGFPSQTFSKSGEGEGFNDPRGQLFFEIIRVLRVHRPLALFLENVSNLLGIDDGTALALIMRELSIAGYDCQWRLINTRTVLPMQRARVYIIGTRRALDTRRNVDGGDNGNGENFCVPAVYTLFEWPELPVLDTQLRDVLEGEAVDNDPRYLLSESRYRRLVDFSRGQKKARGGGGGGGGGRGGGGYRDLCSCSLPTSSLRGHS